MGAFRTLVIAMGDQEKRYTSGKQMLMSEAMNFLLRHNRITITVFLHHHDNLIIRSQMDYKIVTIWLRITNIISMKHNYPGINLHNLIEIIFVKYVLSSIKLQMCKIVIVLLKSNYWILIVLKSKLNIQKLSQLRKYFVWKGFIHPQIWNN